MTRLAPLPLALGLALASCSGAQTARPPRGPITARDYLPLRVGAAWSYDTATGYGTGTVLSAMTVVRADGQRYLVRTDGRTATYELRPDGVMREGEYYVKDPVRVGATWEGRDGARFEVRAVDQTRTVGGQRFTRVIEVLRSGSSSQIRTTTWYALDVGAIEISADTTSSLGQTISVHSTLRGYTLGE
ncbi:MAG: hypothetical protein U0324_38110 [Polyangiales bacterium]